LGCETVLDAFKTPEVEKYINQMMSDEVLPVIDEDPEELKKFAEKILERFYNPFLKHYLKDISLNSLSKWETRDFPTVKDNFTKKNKKAKLAIFSFAALLVLYSGKSAVAFTPNDTAEFVDFIQSSFDPKNIKAWVEGIVKNKKMWKENFSSVPFFIDEVTKNIELILSAGMKEAVKAIISNEKI
jgi:tagaturonate reductase